MITVLGSTNIDLIVRVERLPRPGETVSGRDFASAPGGKGANQALAAARAGGQVRMVGAVGRDSFAEAALSLLRAGGVDLQHMRSAEGPTGVALIQVDDRGENTIAVAPGANGTITPADAAPLDFGPGDVLLLQLEIPLEGMQEAAKRARAADAMVLLNCAPFHAPGLRLASDATHLLLNEAECRGAAEAAGLTETSLERQAMALARQYRLSVIVTLGRDGVMAATEENLERVPAFAVEAVDTVGAGDTFCGYLAVGLSEGMPLDEALLFASAAGGLACTKPGAQPAIPHRAEVESMWKSG